MIDAATYERYTQTVAEARLHGVPVIEALDRHRLLWTPKREHDASVRALEETARRLDRQTANKIMSYYHGRTDGTPAEMFLAMQLWMEAVVRNWANKTLEDL